MLAWLFRYSRHDKRSKLPSWILSHLRDAHLNLSTDMAVQIAREVCTTLCLWTCLFLFVNGLDTLVSAVPVEDGSAVRQEWVYG